MLPDVVIAYVAHTERATFLLDSGGICRHVITATLPPQARSTEIQERQAAERCLGAQYVASIDARTKGGLVDLPRAGIPMLFAIADANGRISVIRTAPLLRFEVRPTSQFAPRGSPRDSIASEFEREVNDPDISGPQPRISGIRPGAGPVPEDLYGDEQLATRIFDHESVLEQHEETLRRRRAAPPAHHAVPPPPLPRSPRQMVPRPPPAPVGHLPMRSIHKKIV